MPDQHAGNKGIAIDPDLSIIGNVADLHSDLVGMSDYHDRQLLVIVRIGIEDQAGVSLELMDAPVCLFQFLKCRFEHSVTHGTLQSNR